MSRTNCVNCGAAKEIADTQCPFCGTQYVDFSTLSITSDDPLFIQFTDSDGNVRTAKAYITDRTIRATPEWLDCRDVSGRLHRLRGGMHVSGSVDFAFYESI